MWQSPDWQATQWPVNTHRLTTHTVTGLWNSNNITWTCVIWKYEGKMHHFYCLKQKKHIFIIIKRIIVNFSSNVRWHWPENNVWPNALTWLTLTTKKIAKRQFLQCRKYRKQVSWMVTLDRLLCGIMNTINIIASTQTVDKYLKWYTWSVERSVIDIT